jgi:transcriptional regulator with XRE-family HTH domain
MDTYSQVAWERLGTALKERRVALGYGYRRRGDFAQDTGMGGKTLQRLENGERSYYPAETIAQAEAAYQLEPGSVVACLRGGSLRALARGAEELSAEDAFEEAVLAASLPYAEKADAVRRHREQARAQLAELGLDPPPSLLRKAVRRMAGEPDEAASDAERRGA